MPTIQSRFKWNEIEYHILNPFSAETRIFKLSNDTENTGYLNKSFSSVRKYFNTLHNCRYKYRLYIYIFWLIVA